MTLDKASQINLDDILVREATQNDLGPIIDMLADDALGLKREDNRRPLSPAYQTAFTAITDSPDHQLIVIEHNHQIAAVVQLSVLPNLSHQGTPRGLIEGVRVHADYRFLGLGRRLINAAITHAKFHGCRMVQLTSDKQRPEAIRFYESMGFKSSHEGLKLAI